MLTNGGLLYRVTEPFEEPANTCNLVLNVDLTQQFRSDLGEHPPSALKNHPLTTLDINFDEVRSALAIHEDQVIDGNR